MRDFPLITKMANLYSIIWINIFLIYPGMCLHYNEIPDLLMKSGAEEIVIVDPIGQYFFKLQWISDSDTYRVSVDGYEDVTDHECPDTKSSPNCTFDSTKYSNIFDYTTLMPCQEITVKVTGTGLATYNPIKFYLAPAIPNNGIDPQISLSDNTVSVTWTTPASSDDGDISCATRAKAAIRLGVASDWLYEDAKSVTLDAESISLFDLTECQHGKLYAKIVYLSLVGDYPTNREFSNQDLASEREYFSGTGVTTVNPKTSKVSCSLNVEWDVPVCSPVHQYKVAWNGNSSTIDGHTTTLPITDLTVGTHSVSVQAYWSKTEKMGKIVETVSEKILAAVPNAPAKPGLVPNDSPPWKLTVSWIEPTGPTCADTITGYSITCGNDASASGSTGAEKLEYECKELNPCTTYDVTVAANSSVGLGEVSTHESKETGSQAPENPVPIVESYGHTDITLKWAVPSTTNSCPITGYNIIWTPKDGETDTGDAGKDDTSYAINNLTCNTIYTITVTAKTEGKKPPVSDEITQTTSDKTPESTNVESLLPGEDNSKLNVTWSGPDNYDCTGGLGEYKISWMAEGDGRPTVTENVTESPYNITGLAHCTPYTVNVQARSKTGTLGPQGVNKTTNTTADPPGKPTDIAGITDPSSITVSWTPPDITKSCSLTNYTVDWVPGDGDGTGGTHSNVAVSESPSDTITDLTCNNDYTVTVTATTTDGKTKSDEKIIKTEDKDPGATAVTGVSPPDDSHPTQLIAKWSGPENYTCTGGLGDYKVTWTAKEDDKPTDTANVAKTPYTINSLVPCTTYTVDVEASSNTGRPGILGTKTGTTAVEVPGISSNISKESSYTPYSLDVNWKEPPISSPDGNPCTITNYTVEWSSNSIGGSASGVTSRPYTIQDLNACTDYNITVIAYTDKGPGEASVSKLTTDADVPGLITDLTNTSVTANSLEVTWSPPPVNSRNPCKIIKYTVKWVSSSGDSGQDDTVNELSYNITGLIPCTDYAITVIAYTEEGGGNSSKAVTFTTDTDVPGISTDIKRKSYTPESLEVTWSPPPTSPSEGGNPCDITNYTVQWSNSSDGIHQGHSEITGVDRSYNITGLDACTDYYISIIAYTKTGFGETSEVYTNSTGVNAPKVAEDEVYIDYTSRDAQVTWLKPDTSCKLTYEVEHSGYTLWTNNQTSDPGKTQTIVDPIHNANLEELLPYSKYDVCVTVNNNINGENTSKTFTTEEAVSSEPRNVSVEDVDDVSLTLTWEFPAAENGVLLNYIVSWGVDGETTTNHTVDADITYHSIYELEEGKYFFSVRAVNSKGSSGESIYIEQEMNGPSVCGGGCIAGIVIGLLLVALAIPAFIFRDRIMQTIKPGPPPVEESPYELRGAAILKSDFRRHVEELGLDRAERAYQMLNDESQQKTKFAAAKPFNKGKNRFANIHPFDETRVKLQLMRNGPKGSDYINANHITFPDTFALKFTATQGPLDSTINDFWRMIWEHKVYDTVMLCNLFEKGKSKCAQYWTENGERSMEFGDFKISCQAEEEDESKTFITRYIDVVKDGQHRMVKQHHFLAWPDFGVPENEEGLLRFLASVKQNVNEHGTNVLTHCSAGVGRTGTFIALWVLTSLLEQNKSAKSIDVHQISLMMREGRSDMIQTKDQYLYLHKCLLKYMEDTGNSFPISNKDDEEPIYGNVNTGYQQ